MSGGPSDERVRALAAEVLAPGTGREVQLPSGGKLKAEALRGAVQHRAGGAHRARGDVEQRRGLGASFKSQFCNLIRATVAAMRQAGNPSGDQAALAFVQMTSM